MKIYKGKYGHQAYCSTTDKEGNKVNYYLSVGYKNGVDLANAEDYEGTLVLKTPDGKEHECFLTCYLDKNGTAVPKLVILS